MYKICKKNQPDDNIIIRKYVYAHSVIGRAHLESARS